MNSRCDCHYRGALIDGREFDSSYARGPATFTPSEVIKGWCEALLLMKEGDVWQLYVPSELAYGDCSRSRLCMACVFVSSLFEQGQYHRARRCSCV
jgi:FKBP-type peptidyl-prolyl cis-trans isomerase